MLTLACMSNQGSIQYVAIQNHLSCSLIFAYLIQWKVDIMAQAMLHSFAHSVTKKTAHMKFAYNN